MKNPPLAPLAFRVGVAGHRPNRLQHADMEILAAVMKEILTAIKDAVIRFQFDNPGFYNKDTPVLRAITPLAEGSDRIFAEQALASGYDLCCIMPFHRGEFEKDFEPGKSLEPGPLKTFQGILSRAEQAKRLTCFELDGNRSDESSAYYQCTKTVLNQSDLLIVVWDGEFQGKSGGTEDAFRDALRIGIPVLWIDAHKDHSWQLITNGNEFHFTHASQRMTTTGENDLQNIIDNITCTLGLTGENIQQIHLNTFYGKHKPLFTTAVIWKCFRDVFGDGKFPKPVFSIAEFEESLGTEWTKDNSTSVSRMVNFLRPFYAWPDKLAVLYSDRYRSAFIFTFFLAALAVGMALLPIAGGLVLHSIADIACISVEMLMILLIIGLVYFCRRNDWHGRWIDYRLLAESIRHLRLVAPVGGNRPFLQPPAHLKAYGQPESTWVAWYVRAVERSLGVPSVVVDKDHMLSCLNHLTDLLKEQIRYHETNNRRCRSIDRKLHGTGLLLLVLTILSCFVHFSSGIGLHANLPDWLSPHLMTFFCGFLPALSAAMAGINNQGEFTRISKRSEAMQEQLEIIQRTVKDLRDEIQTAKTDPAEPYSVKTAEIIGKTARLLTNEVLDWRVVFLDRPLNVSM